MEKQQLLYDLFKAYYEARKNKRNTLNQLDFEINLEENLIKLYEELINGTYKIGKSIYFIQQTPVKREIFAGNFRDRVVHHLIYNYISPIFEREFIYDSYSCRKGKGTSFGIKRLQKFIRSSSENYTKDSYILKLDVSGYFMSMNKSILFEKIKKSLNKIGISSLSKGSTEVRGDGLELKYTHNLDYYFIINLIQKVIFNDCTVNSIFKGNRQDYIGLPKNKSLFFAKNNTGLPIGNLTSQIFSNIYMSDFDKYIKNELKIKYYGRYVDDFCIIHTNKDYLKSLIPKITQYLQQNLGLTIHPKKIYFQHYSKGVLFLGVFIKPYRTYIRKRTVGFFYKKIENLNNDFMNKNYEMNNILAKDFLSVVNSYLGMFKHHKSYKIRKKILIEKINKNFWNYFYINNDYTIIKRKNKILI